MTRRQGSSLSHAQVILYTPVASRPRSNPMQPEKSEPTLSTSRTPPRLGAINHPHDPLVVLLVLFLRQPGDRVAGMTEPEQALLAIGHRASSTPVSAVTWMRACGRSPYSFFAYQQAISLSSLTTTLFNASPTARHNLSRSGAEVW